MDASQFRKAAHCAIEDIIEYYESVAEYPVLPRALPGILLPEWPSVAPWSSEECSVIQSDIATAIIPNLTRWQSPKFMATHSAGVEYSALLGEIYAAAFTAPGFDSSRGHTTENLEKVVIDWWAQALDLPIEFWNGPDSTGGGVIHGSKSESIITCMIAARERYLKERCNEEGWYGGSRGYEERKAYLRTRLVAISSEGDYNPTKIGAHIIGTLHRSVPVTFSENLSVTARCLQNTLSRCRREGLEPYFVTLAFGTSSTGIVDDFPSIRPVLQIHPKIWVHVDAGDAGAVLVCREHSCEYYNWFGMADSFNMSPQKWMLINFDVSCTFVKNHHYLTQVNNVSADAAAGEEIESALSSEFKNWQMSIGRRSPALTIWLVMRNYGVLGIQEHIRSVLWLGDLFAGLVRSRPDLFELIAPPAFALTCFRVRVPDTESEPASAFSSDSSDTYSHSEDDGIDEQANEITRQVLGRITQQGHYFFSGSTIAGKDFIRVVSGNNTQADVDTTQKWVRDAFKLIVRTTVEIWALRKIRMNTDPTEIIEEITEHE